MLNLIAFNLIYLQVRNLVFLEVFYGSHVFKFSHTTLK
jgi:hypothetical protein